MVDAGDLTWKAFSISDDRLAQQRLKAELQLDVYTAGGVDAMLPGKADLALGVQWLSAVAGRYEVPYVAANLDCSDWSLPPGIVKEQDGVTVAFVGVVGQKLPAGCSASPAASAVGKALAQLENADVYVLLSQQTTTADQRLVEAFPQIDIVVNGSGRSELLRPRTVGSSSVWLAPGTRGKKLGVADIVLVEDGDGVAIAGFDTDLVDRLEELERRSERTKQRLRDGSSSSSRAAVESRLQRLDLEIADTKNALAELKSTAKAPRNRLSNRLVSLSSDVADHPEVKLKLDGVKRKIEDLGRSMHAPKHAATNRVFVGDKPCLGCHQEQHEQWRTTRHSQAWDTLVQVKRSQDLACWECHVTGAHHPDGPTSPSAVGVLRNVGCESCHGPGRKHVEQPGKANIVRMPSVAGCKKCHDGIKDEGRFEAAVYMKKVTH